MENKIFNLLGEVKELLVSMGYEDIADEISASKRAVEEREAVRIAKKENASNTVIIDDTVILLVDDKDVISFNGYNVDFETPIVINKNLQQGEAIKSAYDLLITKYIKGIDDVKGAIDVIADKLQEKITEEAKKMEVKEEVSEPVVTEETKDDNIEDAVLVEDTIKNVKEVSNVKELVHVQESTGETIVNGTAIPSKFFNNRTKGTVDLSSAERGKTSLEDIISGKCIKDAADNRKKEEDKQGTRLIFSKDGLKGDTHKLNLKGGSPKESSSGLGKLKLNIPKKLEKQEEAPEIAKERPKTFEPNDKGLYLFYLSASNALIPITDEESNKLIKNGETVIAVGDNGYECLSNDVDESIMKVAIKHSNGINVLPDYVRKDLLDYANE